MPPGSGSVVDNLASQSWLPDPLLPVALFSLPQISTNSVFARGLQPTLYTQTLLDSAQGQRTGLNL